MTFKNLVSIIYSKNSFLRSLRYAHETLTRFQKRFYFVFIIMNFFHNLSILTGIDYWILTTWFFIVYFSPIFIQLFYKGFTRGLFRTTLFLWWTPLPRMILTLNIIESNKGNDEINDWIDQILENQEKIMKKLNLDFIINEQDDHS